MTTEPLDGFDHCDRITSAFAEEAGGKYQAGYLEHGGRLWRKAQLCDKAIEEAHDLVIYLHTLRDQLAQARRLLASALSARDWAEASQAFAVLATGNADGIPEEDR